jgi:MFS family permease
MPDGHDPYAALRSRDFRLLLASSLLASTASEMQAVAIGFELYHRTGRPADLGYVGLVQFLPVLLLSLPAGHATDRFNRQAMLVAAQTLAVLASLGLAALSFTQGPVPVIYLCVLLAGIGQALSMPARWALVPQAVPEQDLGNAVTWSSSGWQIASLVGPAIGGLIVSHTGQAVAAYLLAAGFSVVGSGCVLMLRPRAAERAAEPVSLDSLLAGLRFVLDTKPILATITLDLFAVLLGGATALLPVFQKDILAVDPAWLGWLRAAPSSGALLMAVVLAHRGPLRRPGVALLWSVAGFGLATVGFGLSRNAPLSFVLLAITGALDNVSVVVRGTLVQVLTPDAMRGRVTAVNAVFISSSNELGAFESGITAQWFGPVASVVGGGIGTVFVVVAVMSAWPQVLRLGTLEPSAPCKSLLEGESGLAADEYPPPRR